MQQWQSYVKFGCGMILGWTARTLLSENPATNEMHTASSGWRSEVGNFWDPQAKQTWFIFASELTFACKESNKAVKARARGGEWEVHFSSGKIVMGALQKSGYLQWGDVVDEKGARRWSSSAKPWRRV